MAAISHLDRKLETPLLHGWIHLALLMTIRVPGREKDARSPCEEPPRTSSDSGARHRKSCARAHACEVHTCRRPSVGLGPRDRAPDHATRRLPCRAHAGGRAYRVLALAACVIALSLHNLGEQYARYILFFYWHTAVKIAEIFCDVSSPGSVYLS